MEEFYIPHNGLIGVDNIEEESLRSEQYVPSGTTRAPELTRISQRKGKKWVIIIESEKISRMDPALKTELEKQLSRYCAVGIAKDPSNTLEKYEYIGLHGQEEVKDKVVSWFNGTANTTSKTFKRAIKDQSPILFGEIKKEKIALCNFL